MNYYGRLRADASIQYLTSSLSEIFSDLKGKKILCAGGSTGRLGRHIAAENLSATVIEIDTSMEMVTYANNLAFQQGLSGRFKSTLGDVSLIPFPDDEFDYVIAHGLFRYLKPAEQKKAAGEMLRVSRYGATVAEGKAREIIHSLRYNFDPNLPIRETELPMFRMSLFFMLLKQYERDKKFSALVNSTNKDDPIKLLIDLAGNSIGVLYELRLHKES